jgi:ABC-type uncharacterized transport system involved in gliding motility auxiliary subunit
MLKRIVGIIGWIGTVVVFAAVAVRFLHPAWERYSYWMAWAGLGCIVLYAVGQWREIGQLFSRRQARLGTIAIAGILVALGIVVAVNYLASRENKRWDLTSAREYTLSDQTQKVLSKLDAPLNMIVFARQTEFDRYRLTLKEYAYLSKNVSVEYVDPDRNPDRTKQYQIQTYGTILLAYKTRTERVMSDSEQDLANGIIKVVTGEQKKVCFVEGHDERDTASTDPAGYSTVAAAIARDNYSVDKVNLAQRPDVPADASVVVVAGPKDDFLAPEVDALRRYLQKGGKLLLLLDPPEKADSPPLTNLVALAHEWGIAVNNDIVVDTSGMGQFFGTGPLVPLAGPPYPTFPITERFRLNTAFPLARSVTPATGGVNGHNAQPFVQTSADSWATDAQRALKANKIEIKQDADKQGPIPVAAAVSAPVDQKAGVEPANQNQGAEKPKAEIRVAVVGDSDFVANNYIAVTRGNSNLFMNTINWLAQQENLISIRPREPEDRRLTITTTQQRNLMLLSLLVIPALIFASGVYTWWRRR